MPGVDASVELVAELDRLTPDSAVARDAPRSKALYAYLSRGMESNAASGSFADEFTALAIKLFNRLGVWWSPAAYGRLPS